MVQNTNKTGYTHEMKHKASIKLVSWRDVRKQVANVRPKLAALVDEVDPDSSLPLYIAKYPYGKVILDKGILHIPTEDGSVLPVSSQQSNSTIRESLSRRTTPLSLILEKSCEVYTEASDRVISLNLFERGFMFGLWENLDPIQSYFVKQMWSVASGARSIFLLPKVTETACHKHLRKKYGVRTSVPRNIHDHWKIFTDIASSQAFEQEWHTEILFFGDQWMDTITTDQAWHSVYNYLLLDGWNQSQYWRNKVSFDIAWEKFTDELRSQNIKPNPYFVAIVKHLVLVGTGVLPGSSAASLDDIIAPVSGIQKAYVEDYRLKQYKPTILGPKHYCPSDNVPVYYSLKSPSLLENTLASNYMSSTMSVIPEIQLIIEKFSNEVLHGLIKANNTPINTFVNGVKLDYFHHEAKEGMSVKNTILMPQHDENLVTSSVETDHLQFAATGHFIRGCIRMTNVS